MFSRTTMLHHHLVYNHYPPLPEKWVSAAEEAIDAYNDGEPDRLIQLPGTDTSFYASTLVEDWHLDEFIQYEED
jgi:hypothetical protein